MTRPAKTPSTRSSTKGKTSAEKISAAEKSDLPNDNQVKRGRGRPTIYTKELADDICTRLANGDSLRKACADITKNGTHIDESTVRQWVIDNYGDFYRQYTRAIQARAIRWAEEIMEISDDGSNDTYIDPDSGAAKTDHEVVARSRLRVDTRKWMLSKVLPKVYGDKLDVNHGGQTGNPVETVTKVVMVPAKEAAVIERKRDA